MFAAREDYHVCAEPAGHGVRIALYIRSVQSGRGAERSIINVCKGLAERGHHVDLVVDRDEGWLLDQLRGRDTGVRIISLRTSRLDVLSPFQSLMAAVRQLAIHPRVWTGVAAAIVYAVAHRLPVHPLRMYLKHSRPHVLLSFLNKANVTVLLAAALGASKTRLAVTFHNTLSVAADLGTSRRILDILPVFLRHADKVVAVSAGVREDLLAISNMGITADRFTVLHNPVFNNDILRLADAPLDHPSFGDPSVPVVVAAGKLSPQKDYPTLLNAFALVRKRRAVRLLILGDGEEHDRLKRLCHDLGIAEDVEFTGYVRNPYPFFRKADLFVMSSRYEGLPTSLIEAIACGCPAVSTDCPSGPDEILAGGQYGRLTPVGDSQALADAILETLDAPIPTEILIERARKFSFERAIDAYEDLVLAMASSSRVRF